MSAERLTKKQRRELRRQKRKEAEVLAIRNRKLKRFIVWPLFFIFSIATVVGLVIVVGKAPTDEGKLLSQGVTDQDRVLGSEDAQSVLVEYSDYQCPACKTYHELMKQITQEYSDRLLFAYRQFPITQIHDQAELASIAAEAAANQDKFWEMHNLLFENQSEWSENDEAETIFKDYAVELELDLGKFNEDLVSETIREKVLQDFQSGIDSGVSGTPTFFLNGEKVDLPADLDGIKSVLDLALNQD